MVKGVRRLVVVLAGVSGLLALSGAAAHASVLIGANHCEPLRRQ